MEDVFVEILYRLSERDLVACMNVCRSWRRISSDVWVRKFWVRSPVIGLYYNVVEPQPPYPHVVGLPWYGMFYMSLYNFYSDQDNEIQTIHHNAPIWPRSFLPFKFSNQISRMDRRSDGDTDHYLDGCNGLLLLLKAGCTSCHQFYVCNPITKQQVAIPKAFEVHHRHEQFCAALAFDPIESPHHYRVVRIDYSDPVLLNSTSTVKVDIFWSQYGQWIRHRVQLDPEYIEGFKNSKQCRHFVYLRGKLYGVAMTWKLLWIDINAKLIRVGALQLPDIPNEADKTGATIGSCLGISMELLCYIKRDISNTIHVWSYDDRCGESSWILKYSVTGTFLAGIREELLEFEEEKNKTPAYEPYAISPNSDVLFFGTPNSISGYDLKSRYMDEIQFVCTTWDEGEVAAETAAGYYFPTFPLRACFIPFSQLCKTNAGGSATPLVVVCEGTEILSTNERSNEEDDEDAVLINVDLCCCDDKKEPIPMFYPSELPNLGPVWPRRNLD